MRIHQLIIILLLATNIVSAYYYDIALEYNNGNISYIESGISSSKIFDNIGGYYASIFSFDDKLLNKTSFSMPNKLIYDISNGSELVSGGITILNKTNFTISLPYYENAKEIKISKYNATTNKYDKILTIDVSYYSKEIPKDYKITKENITMAKEEIKELNLQNNTNLMIYGFLILVLILIIIVLFKIRKYSK